MLTYEDRIVDSSVQSPLFSIICVSHRPDVLKGWLLPSLASQTASHELIVVDQAVEKHRSCAAALNAGAARAAGQYFLFVHHDVAWDSPTFLDELAMWLERLSPFGIAGVAGSALKARFPYRTYENAVMEGDPGRLFGRPLDGPLRVQTVDELLLVVPRDLFRRMPFDVLVCDDWHLYGVDYSLSVARMGLDVWVVPLIVRHRSSGKINAGYYRSLGKVCRKHRSYVRRICSTVGTWDTRLPDRLHPASRALHGLIAGMIWRLTRWIRKVPDALLPPPVREWKHRKLAETNA